MEMVLSNGFCELESEEMQSVYGGDVLFLIRCGVKLTILIGKDLQNCYDIGYAEGLSLRKKGE